MVFLPLQTLYLVVILITNEVNARNTIPPLSGPAEALPNIFNDDSMLSFLHFLFCCQSFISIHLLLHFSG